MSYTIFFQAELTHTEKPVYRIFDVDDADMGLFALVQVEHYEFVEEKLLEIGKIVNVEFPAENIEQAADEWGKHVLNIAINRLRALGEIEKYATELSRLVGAGPTTIRARFIGDHLLSLIRPRSDT